MKEYIPIELIDEAYRDCCKHKGGTEGCLEYKMNYLLNNLQLYNELNSMTYEIGKSKAFCVTRPKLREVFCAQFRDRIVHHILAIKFLPILECEWWIMPMPAEKERELITVSTISGNRWSE